MEIKTLYQKYIACNYTICTDTRNITKGSLFIALKGANFKANEYAESALKNGCKYAVIDNVNYQKNEQYILVEDTLKTLQELANYHRNQFDIPVIAITGTNGKTTTKELVNEVLCQQFKTHYTKGNLNNHIGVPLTLLSMLPNTEIAIIEMGANHPKEIDFLCKIAQPNYGLITNIGKAHLEGFGNFNEIINTKNELYQYIKTNNGKLFINKKNELLISLANGIDQLSYGEDSNTEATLIEQSEYVTIEWNKHLIHSKLIGAYNFENILAAICIGNYFNIDNNKIIKAIENYTPTNNRSQLIKKNTNTIILDAYNANPSSMKLAIENFNSVNATTKTLIIGQMNELGESSIAEHNTIIKLIYKCNFNSVYLIGSEFKKIKTPFQCFENVDELIVLLQNSPLLKQYILIKGSRSIQLEKIVEFL